MTTASAQPPARVPTPRPKHSRTSSLQSESAAAPKPRSNQFSTSTDNNPQLSQQQPGPPRRGGGARAASADPLSDKATSFLIRRILCPQQPDKGKSSPESIEDLLPPLTSRNDVDLQLYALIAIILREFVQNWYAKITTDETFVAEIVQIIAHITRALEQRLRKVDLESLLFDELPELVDRHVTAYRVAHEPATQPPVRTDPREIYHSLCPLPALSPVPRPEDPESVAAQAENEAAYRQLLVYAFLAILLPTEDLENGCLTALVGQIFSELIIGNAVANRLSEPWLIWELLIIASRTAARRKIAEDDDRLGKPSNGSPGGRNVLLALQGLFWTVLQWCFLAVSFIRTAFTIILASGSLPSRRPDGEGSHQGATRHKTNQQAAGRTRFSDTDRTPSKTPVLAFRAWSAMSNLAGMDTRMPWLCSTFSMAQWIAIMGPGRIAGVDGKLDRLLSYGIHRSVLDAANLPPLLRVVRGALFPNNMPAGKSTLVAPASDAELRALRRRCASALWALVPKGVGRLYFGGGLLRASPVSRASQGSKTEGSAEQLKTARSNNDSDRGKHKRSNKGELELGDGNSDKDKGLAALSSSSSSAEGKEKARRRHIETVTSIPKAAADQAQAQAQAQAPAAPPQEQERSSPTAGTGAGAGSGSPRSRRSAPAPRPKTGGQGSRLLGASSTAAPGSISAGGEASSSGMASPLAGGLTQGDEKGQRSPQRLRRRRRDRDHGRNHGRRGNDVDDVDVDDNDNDRVDDGNDDDAGDEAILEEIERGILGVFGDAYCNKHLVYSILELVLVRLLPELTEKGVLELWGERVSVES